MKKNGEDAGKCNFFVDWVKYPGKGRLKGAMGFAAGVGAFLLFFLSDYNDWRWSRRSLRVCFPLGVLLLTAGTAWEIWQGTPPLHGWLRGAAVLLAVFFFGLLVYTLFFALPVEASYARPGEERRLHHRSVRPVPTSRCAVVCGTVWMSVGRRRTAALGGGGAERIECRPGGL